ncbi:MAG: thioredoxin domain-containing protein [Leptospirales bacterium]|nr:thioredoxin domain-containing protein [Leptospirales bacterium]
MTATSSNQKPIGIGLVFALAGIVIAGLLVCKHIFPEYCQSSYGCAIDGVDGCADLGKSEKSKLFGIPIAIPGLFFYATCAGLLFLLLREVDRDRQAGLATMLLALAVFGTVFDLILAYTNFFVLVVPCRLCIYTYFCTAGILGIAIWLNKMTKQEKSKDIGLVESAKLALPGAGIGVGLTVLVFAFIFTASKVSGKPSASGDLLEPAKVTETLQEFRALTKVDLNTAGLEGYEGPANAPIVIQDFADFMCPHCYHASKEIQGLLKRWPGRIKVYYRHFPLDGTCNPLVQRKDKHYGEMRCNGAQAAICGPEQKILPALYHNIFELQNDPEGISVSNLQAATEKSGGNWPRLLACMQSPATNAALQRDIRDAQSIKLNSTPTIIVNDRLLPAGTPDETYFKHLMDALVYEKEGEAAYKEFGARK